MKILGYEYKMKLVPERENMGNDGACNPSNNVILITDGRPEDRTQSTVLHEIIEALNYNMELELEHPVITQLESGLFQVLTDSGVDLSPLTKELK